jgi:hypothetical protein
MSVRSVTSVGSASSAAAIAPTSAPATTEAAHAPAHGGKPLLTFD